MLETGIQRYLLSSRGINAPEVGALTMKQMCLVCVIAVFSAPAAWSAELPRLRFDIGTPGSPVADGFQAVTAGDAYTPKKGFGWTSNDRQDFFLDKPVEDPSWSGPGDQVIPPGMIAWKEYTAVTADGVMSPRELAFRADVPNGVYRVRLTMGHLHQALGSLQIFINGELVAKDFDVKHFARRAAADHQYGFARTLRRTVRVDNGRIEICVRGDETEFLKRLAAEGEKPPLSSYLTGQGPHGDPPARVPNDPKLWGVAEAGRRGYAGGQLRIQEDIGAPFRGCALNAIEIYPYVAPPLSWHQGQLQVHRDDAALQRAAALFNQQQFAEAEAAFNNVADPYARALGWLWLAGRPQYEAEERLVPQALAALEQIAPDRQDDLMFSEALELARRMNKAIGRFVHRSQQQRGYNECLMISGEVASMQPDDPTYYKGLIYAGRGFYMVIPHRWTMAAGCGRQCFEVLERDGFGDNRFLQWFLHNRWRGLHPDWTVRDYTAKSAGMPPWAAEVHEAFNRELDLAEWWIRQRQQPDGSLGGGWGDDVEILRGLGAFAAVCPDASPLLLQGVRKLADGAWVSGSIDTEAGYFRYAGDTEHTGEWTGDTLPPMIDIDYGNPLYVERALKTAKLMRDVWMDHNDQGHFLMRSNFLGPVGIGDPATWSDSRINYRPTLPARKVVWYNNLPSLRELFVAWADAWHAASMSTARGKPAGIIPQEIGFQGSVLGGVGSPEWYRAAHPPGTVNYDYEGAGGYHEFIVDLLMFAWESTGNEKYLEPLKLEAEFVERHMPDGGSPATGRATAPASELTPGSNEWIASRLAGWPDQWRALQRLYLAAAHDEPPTLRTLREVLAAARLENQGVRERWPHVTTEAMATDRVHYEGLGNATQMMTGRDAAGSEILVTYRGLGRDFAAAVLQATSRRLRVVICNLATEPRSAAVVPWLLQVGGDFEVRIAPDANDDGEMDVQPTPQQIRMESRGQPVPVTIPARQQIVLDVRQTGAANGAKPELPDLALSREDVTYNAHDGTVEVTIHNIGARAARNVQVTLLQDQREIGTVHVPSIEAPLGFDPQVVRVALPLTTKPNRVTVTARLSLPEGQREITLVNNEATVELDLPPAKKDTP
jgi:hypothetical protein